MTNPIYGGAYAYGKTSAVAQYNGLAVGTKSRRKPRGEWRALKPDAHEVYLDWELAEAIRQIVSENIPTSRHHGAPKHGDALLAGLVRCRRCGRKLTVRYSGTKHNIPRYACHRGFLDNGEPRCIAFAGFGSMTRSKPCCSSLLAPLRSSPQYRPRQRPWAPSNWWTPLLSSGGSGKVSNEPGTASFYR